MRIVFSPGYSGFVYLNPAKRKSLLFDGVVTNFQGLLNLAALHSGLHFEIPDGKTRLVKYYGAVKEYTQSNPKHMLADSFETDGLNTARALLEWRDNLRKCGWDRNVNAPSKRMKILSEIENYFDDFDLKDMTDELCKSINQNFAKSLDIVIPCQIDFLHPLHRKLLEALNNNGATIKKCSYATQNGNSNLCKVTAALLRSSSGRITLDPNDQSLRIWHFDTEDDAMRYLATIDDKEFDVWVESDNKQMDNWLSYVNKPTVGSDISNATPQIGELFIFGLGLFSKPLNIKTLLEWLWAPVSPLSRKLRTPLANAIVSKCGYYNDECKSVINNYLNGRYDKQEAGQSDEEFKKEIDNKRKKREDTIQKFLPDIKNSVTNVNGSSAIDKNRIKEFTDNLLIWAKQRQACSADKDTVNALGHLASQLEAFSQLLDTETSATIDYDTVEGWASSIYGDMTCRQYSAKKNCRNVVDSPCKIADPADKIIWCSFHGSEASPLSTDFLTPKEKKAFRTSLSLWDEDKERKYRHHFQMLPFLMASSNLVLVTIDRSGNDVLSKHPLLIKMDEMTKDNEDDKDNMQIIGITDKPLIEKNFLHNVNIIDNRVEKDSLYITLKNPLPPITQSSATALSDIIQHPLDYVMEYIAKLNPAGRTALPELSKMMGTTAHSIIASLFGSVHVIDSFDYVKIKPDIDSRFDEVYAKALKSEGALLLLQENHIEEMRFKQNLKRCVDNLFGLIKDNGLSVAGCEKKYEGNILGTPDVLFVGYLDMQLKDQSGDPYIFDFKWTGSKNYYQNLLKNNKSVQLTVYQALTEEIEKKKVKGAGYYLMPEGKFYTVGGFNPNKDTVVLSISIDRTGNLLSETKNSFDYRVKEFDAKTIENADGMPLIDINYFKDQTAKHLVPLDPDYYDKDKKDTNNFSNNGLFKSRK